MKLHEYQAKQILGKHGVRVADGVLVSKAEDLSKAYASLKSSVVAVKAQIHAGGRGKGSIYDRANPQDPEAKEILKGGVKVAKSEEEAQGYVKQMLGGYLHTIQTGALAKKVSCIYLEAGTDIKKEYYLSILLDRSLKKPVLISSQEGGVEIEEVAARSPQKIVKVPLEPGQALQAAQTREILLSLGIPEESREQGTAFLNSLWNCYVKEDASMLEINPLVLTGNGEIMALDCKMDIDDNALFRHPETAAMRDKGEEDPLELKASEYKLNYIRLTGNVGCMVNGAGLAMGTMDIVKLAGAEPANFLDVGGGANVETVSNGFRIILEDPNVKAIFVNIFGGIVQCDRVAKGIVEAAKLVNINVPLVVRLQGTNAPQAREILANSGISLAVAESLEEGAQKVAKAIAA